MGAKPGDPNEALSVRRQPSRRGPPSIQYEWRCPVCLGSYWTNLAHKTETCSAQCGGKLRHLRNPAKSDAQKRGEARAFVIRINAQTYCAHCGSQPIEWHNPEHVERNREHFRIGRMVSFGKAIAAIKREMSLCTPLCRRCHMAEDGRLKAFKERGDKMRKEQARCYYCHRFISFEAALKNWKVIQAPGVMDPEPYEITWCNDCSERPRERVIR